MYLFPEKARQYQFSDTEINYYTRLLNQRLAELEEDNDRGRYLSTIAGRFPDLRAAYLDFNSDRIKIGITGEIPPETEAELRLYLMKLWPWRKGPFEVFGIHIDTEWKSYLKWDRLKDHITPLYRRHILDIGSSNGYYMFRMLAHDPGFVLGIEPYPVFYYQFRLLKSLAGNPDIYTLPIRFEDMHVPGKKFNSIFCMGILYHRSSPLDFLKKIRMMMAKNGELILETLILEGDNHICLYPIDRYAKMRNVYFIPTITVLEAWLKKSGFRQIECLDIARTDENEQRATEWVNTESLNDFLDPQNRNLTIEGYQAPVRAVLIARV